MTVLTLFSQAATGSSIAADSTDYTMGVQFTVGSSGCTLTGVYFYSASGAVNLPGTIALWAVSGTSLVHSEAASWSGAAGSGWVRAAFASPPSLTSGTNYKASVTRGNGGSGNWYSATSGYWATNGASNGTLSAPNNAGATPGQDSFHVGTAATWPDTSGNGSNYWVDPEVTTPSANFTASGSLALARLGMASSGAAGISASGSAALARLGMAASALTGGNVTSTGHLALARLGMAGQQAVNAGGAPDRHHHRAAWSR